MFQNARGRKYEKWMMMMMKKKKQKLITLYYYINNFYIIVIIYALIFYYCKTEYIYERIKIKKLIFDFVVIKNKNKKQNKHLKNCLTYFIYASKNIITNIQSKRKKHITIGCVDLSVIFISFFF